MNRIIRVGHNRTELIHRLAEHVHHAAQRRPANRNFDACTKIVRLHSAHHALDRLHRNRADAALAKVLLHFRDNVERRRNVVAFARDANRVKNCGQFVRFKLNVEHGSDNLHDVSDVCVFLLAHKPSISISNDH